MKTTNFALILISLFTMTACMKGKETKVEVPVVKIPNSEPYIAKKSGYKCDLAMLNLGESKPIFIVLNKKDKITNIKLYDFRANGKISMAAAEFDGHTLFSIDLKEENDEFVGETPSLHEDDQSLSTEGKVVVVTLKMTLDSEMNGKIDRKLLVKREDNTMFTTQYVEVAELSHCEMDEASYL